MHVYNNICFIQSFEPSRMSPHDIRNINMHILNRDIDYGSSRQSPHDITIHNFHYLHRRLQQFI